MDEPSLYVDTCKNILLQEMNAPSFRVEKNCDGTMLLHYYSDRSGLCHIVPGETKVFNLFLQTTNNWYGTDAI